jgi:paraquat-inducible protein B
MIQMDMLPNEPARIRGNGDIPEIPTIPSGFERLAQALEKISFPELVDNINAAVKQIGSLLDKNEIQKVIDSIKAAADNIAVLSKNLNDEAIPLVQSLKSTADETQLLVRDVNQQVDPVAVDARKALESIQQAMDQADQTLKSIDSLAEGYTERSAFRYEVSNALREIAAAAHSLRTLTDMLQQQPDALIRGRGNPGGQ